MSAFEGPWYVTAEVRFVVPPTTTTNAPKLQQRWERKIGSASGFTVRTDVEWRDVPRIVLDEATP